jgi:tetratricopeptide (TPR) repeat protein
MGRVYVTFEAVSFAVSGAEYAAIGDLLQEVARRAQCNAATLEAFLVDETTGREVPLAGDALLARVLPRDRADVVVRQRADESSAESLKAHGNKLMTDGRFKDAAAAYTQAMASAGDRLKQVLLLNRSLAFMRLQDWAAAERDARAVVESDAENVKARFRLGQALFYAGRFEEAHAALAAGLDLEGLAPQQAVDFGRLLERCEKEHGAGLAGVDAAEATAAREAGLPVAGYRRLRPFYQAAEEAAARGQYASAMQTYRQLLEFINAEDVTSLQGLATCLLRSKSHRYAEARDLLQRLCALRPSVTSWMLLAEAHCGLRSWDAALEACNNAAKVLPPNDTATSARLQVQVSAILLGLERPDAAMQYAKSVLRADENHPGALLAYGRASLASGVVDEAQRAALRLVATQSRDRAAQRFFCETMRRPGAAQAMLQTLHSVGSGRIDPSSLVFLASVAKEYSAVETAVVLLREATRVDPGPAAHALSLVHVLEIDARPREALAALRNWLSTAPAPCAVGEMDPAAVLRAWDRRDGSEQVPKLEEVPSRGVPKHLSLAQLDFVAVVFALVKLLYLEGDWTAISAIARLLEPERRGWDFHLTSIRNEQAFHCCALQCLESHDLAAVNEVKGECVHVLGDSHCLPLAWRRVSGALLIPHLVTGCKMWHLRPEGDFFPKHNWLRATEAVPEGGTALLVLGEIDCREGLLVCIEKGRYASLEEGVAVVVKIFLDEVLALVRRKRLRRVLIHPVPPVLNATRHIVELFNPIYRRAVEQLPADANVAWLDVYDALVEPRQGPLPDCVSAFQLRPQYNLDGTHLNPRYVELLKF